jgi:Zn-dependent peptidase ImmA (M78 family)
MTDSPRSADAARRTSPTLSDLGKHAASLDVTVHIGHLDDGRLGLYDAEAARVWISFGLTPSEQRSVLAHELGHVYFGHYCDTERAEREADRYAADLLICPETYATLEREGMDAHAIADEMNVTVDIVHAYRAHHLQRLGATTYGRRIRGRFTNAIARRLA